VKFGEAAARRGQSAPDLGVVEGRTEIASPHAVDLVRELARVSEFKMIGGERRAERPAGVARRGLHPKIVETAVAQHLAVGDAIEGDAAGEAEIAHAGLGLERAGQPQDRLFGDALDRRRQIHMHPLEPIFGVSRRHSE
jgi:hypothetical protein